MAAKSCCRRSTNWIRLNIWSTNILTRPEIPTPPPLANLVRAILRFTLFTKTIVCTLLESFCPLCFMYFQLFLTKKRKKKSYCHYAREGGGGVGLNGTSVKKKLNAATQLESFQLRYFGTLELSISK